MTTDITTKNFHKIPSGHIRHVGQSLPPLQFPAGFYRGPFDQPHSTRKIENRFTTVCIDHETMSRSYFHGVSLSQAISAARAEINGPLPGMVMPNKMLQE